MRAVDFAFDDRVGSELRSLGFVLLGHHCRGDIGS